ncbi:MAG: hypothetical protein NTX50_26700 [Candidatus Sumerlaeota bacterium]|nr:hypothetical protein [Candidatus Sumerlaeota bacterium]
MLEVGEDRHGRLRVPAVTNRLEAIVLRCDIAEGLFGLHKEPDIAEIRREIERIVRAALRAGHADAALNLHFLLKGVLLIVVIDVPSQSDEKLVNEILANLGFLIDR